MLGVGYCYFGGVGGGGWEGGKGGRGGGREERGEARRGKGGRAMEGRGQTYLGHPLQGLPFLWNQGQVAQA